MNRFDLDDATGPLVRVGFGLTLFFAGSHRPEWRERVVERWSRSPAVRVAAGPDAQWLWESSADAPEHACASQALVIASASWEADPGIVRLGWSPTRVPTMERIVAWCEALQPTDGFAGLHLFAAPERDRAAAAEPAVARLVEAHPGLLPDVPTTWGLVGAGRVKTIGWLTIVGNELRPPPDADVIDYDGRASTPRRGRAPDGRAGAPPRGPRAALAGAVRLPRQQRLPAALGPARAGERPPPYVSPRSSPG